MSTEAKSQRYISEHHEVRSPTLLIGIGGIGGQIVKGVYDAMSEYDRTYVEMIVMDTNVSDLEKFVGTGIHFIQTSENQTVQAYLTANEEYTEWFPTNPLINAKNLTQGAGQIRSVSRLGALASKAEGRFETIDRSIDAVLTNHGDPLVRSVRVMIVGSATGGTGSGLGVQLPFYVRNALERANVPNVLIRGLFLMPSLTEDVQDTEAKKSAVNVNGYAFLKEVNAFYRAQQTIADDNVLRIEEYTPGVKTITGSGTKVNASGAIPYDFLFLVEKYGNRGSIGSLEDYIDRSAQIVMSQLFSPIANRGFSTEDNLITSSVPTGGMNRYCGAGVSNAIYPKDEVIRYCTVRYAGQLIKGYWLQIDDEFRSRDEQQRRLKKTNPKLQSLDRGTTYCTIFDDMCDPQKHDVSSEVASLKGELTIPVTVERNNRTITEDRPFVDTAMQYIEDHLHKALAGSGLAQEAEMCKMDRTLMRIETEVQNEISEKMANLRRFQTAADTKVSELVVSTAEEILPSDLKLAQNVSKDARHNLFVMLTHKHPIIARYALYALRNRMKIKKADSDKVLEGRLSRESIFTKDYYRERGNDSIVESPSDAVTKTPAGLFSFIGLNSAAYTRLVQEITNDSIAEAGHILQMAEHTLKSTVYRIVLERLDVLISLYEEFFEELRTIVTDKEEEAKRLEVGKGSGLDEDFKGDKYVCCNAKCKQFLYDQFVSSVTDAEMEMSDDVKKGFFEKMFGEYATRLTTASNPTAFVVHLSLRDLFEQGVLEPITAQFRNSGFKHLDMSILEAIRKQFEIENHSNGKAQDPIAYTQYFNAFCEALRTLAVPYLTYEREVANYASGGKLSYAWGLNHSAVARYQSGDTVAKVDNQKLKDMFLPSETPLADDSFSPYTMVCYAAIYDLRVENCTMYKVGTDAQKAYNQRLHNIAERSYVISEENDGYLDVIHPHLDRRWHEHAFLPELMGYDEDTMLNDIRLAFMAAVSQGLCTHMEDPTEHLTCWRYKKSDAKHASPIFVDDKELRAASIAGLYNAFNRNRVIVEDILKRMAAQQQESYESRSMEGITEKDILGHTIISSFIGIKSGSVNILDRLYSLLLDSGSQREIDRLIGTLENYLYQYCYEMVNKNKHKAEAMCQTVKYAIGAGSARLKADSTSLIYKDTCSHFLKTSN